jgi:galactose mutarotase-like enzyme
VPFDGFDLQAREVDLHLLDHQGSELALHLGDGSRIELRASRDLAIWVVWTLADKDFVCVEPWTAPGDALNSGERLIQLEPGAWHQAQVDVEFFGVLTQ